MNCSEAKKIDIVNFLARNSIMPDYSKGVNIWYKSPLRKEEKPSFKVNSEKNLWFDFGMGDGGDVIKLACLLFDIDYTNALKLLSKEFIEHASKTGIDESTLIVNEVTGISSTPLINYIKSRGLDLKIVMNYCKEVSFRINNKNYYAIGFKNSSNGYELRSKFFKGSSSPKDISLVKNDSDILLVFEGFTDFLSWFSCDLFFSGKQDYLVLNSLSFLKKSKPIIEGYKEVFLYLDNDNSGKKATMELVNSLSNCIDKSECYLGFKDLNEYLVKNFQIKGT